MKCTNESKLKDIVNTEKASYCTESWLCFMLRAIKKEFVLTAETTGSCKQRVLTAVLLQSMSYKWKGKELRKAEEHRMSLSQQYKIALDLLLGCITVNSLRR